ncbi:MAG: exodeoxyribonuclease VII large subunit [Anaerovoracaceae bacterium]
MGLKPVKLSHLNSYIKRVLQTDPIFGNVSVIGEVLNLKFHGSGDVYFSLKDEQQSQCLSSHLVSATWLMIFGKGI